MSKLFPTAEEQGVQGTTADFLPIAKLFGILGAGGLALKGASKVGGKMDDAIKSAGNKPLFSPEEWADIQRKLGGNVQGPSVITKQ